MKERSRHTTPTTNIPHIIVTYYIFKVRDFHLLFSAFVNLEFTNERLTSKEITKFSIINNTKIETQTWKKRKNALKRTTTKCGREKK